VPIRSSILLRSAAAILAVVTVVAVTYAAEPKPNAAATQPAGATTLPRIINQTGTTLPLAELAKSGPPTTMVSMNFKNAPIDTVLEFLSAKAGYVFVVFAPPEVKLTLIFSVPCSSDELPALLDTALEAQGYGVLPTGRVLTVDARAKLLDQSGIPLRYGGDPTQIADTDDQIAQIIPAKDINVRTIFPGSGFASTPSIVANPDGSNSIIATGASREVKRIAQIILDLDAQGPASDHMFVRHLIHADAQEAVSMVNKNYPPTTTPARSGGGTATAPDLEAQRVIVSCDERSNNVVVSGPKEKLAAIQILLDKFDAPAPGATTIPTTAAGGLRGGR